MKSDMLNQCRIGDGSKTTIKRNPPTQALPAGDSHRRSTPSIGRAERSDSHGSTAPDTPGA